MIYFITGNANKFNEIKTFIPYLEQLDIEFPEIQDINPHTVISAKLQEALKHTTEAIIVEDTSLSLDCMNGFPGPLIKWLSKSIGNEGIYELTQKYQNPKAIARTVIGFAVPGAEFNFFEGTLDGTIRKAAGDNGFGWDKIFAPGDSSLTFAQMAQEEKNKISMRKIATLKLKEFLDTGY